MQDRSFIYRLNDFEIRNNKRQCICRICDKAINNEKIVYIRSFRGHGDAYIICIPCWKKCNLIVEELDKE